MDAVFTLFGNDVQTRVNAVNSNLRSLKLKDVDENTKAVFVDLRYNAPKSERPAELIYKKGAKYGGNFGGDVAVYNAIRDGKIKSISDARKNARLKSIEKAMDQDLKKSQFSDDPRESKPTVIKQEVNSA